ncbi:hypothetical protein BLNAU_9710 [Blattamonas nauphoetae]|uniref:Uncharacterized protein n=1 Tax=Blattamonas nauphoetae TaxID=2049346 RepID=A0ABQ9XV04_9EUKA|nr:hypothetical protein BLNAU_9710 [Blattamonas nauphoetae]
MALIEILYSKSPSFVRSSLSSEIPSFILTHFENWSTCPALESCCSCLESLFLEPEIVDSLFLQHEDLLLSTFEKIGSSSPPWNLDRLILPLALTKEWRHGKQERQKIQEVLLREEGWDDGFELRVVGIEVDTNDTILTYLDDSGAS